MKSLHIAQKILNQIRTSIAARNQAVTSHAELPSPLFATRLRVGELALIDILLQENQHGIVAKNQQQYGCHLCEAVIKDGNKFSRCSFILLSPPILISNICILPA